MNSQRTARFVRRWFAEWEAEPPKYGRASQILDGLIQVRPDEAWIRILELFAQAKAESLGFVASGPLEDLLSVHGALMIDRVEAAAVTNVRFASCLAGLWGDSRFDPIVHARIQRLIHPSPA